MVGRFKAHAKLFVLLGCILMTSSSDAKGPYNATLNITIFLWPALRPHHAAWHHPGRRKNVASPYGVLATGSPAGTMCICPSADSARLDGMEHVVHCSVAYSYL
ncbi:hypothetical protein BDY21DRAFT_203470 [Lineolata rhizophorae]|uniref:Secreted protein n=1 Tax=Lineolata rhizophorae TaxID=578093 RepID=A0A6A6P5C4_9PEZI|nr:hypothetical protein BDY21DRAFT_203470 [Lineolata rhizophorae]